MILGPAGAWLFRVADLMRRRAVFKTGRLTAAGEPDPGLSAPVAGDIRHPGLVARTPCWRSAMRWPEASRKQISDWRGYYESCSDKFFHVNDAILAAAGKGAIRGGRVE